MERSVPILFLISSLAVGGSERKTVNIANNFAALGREVCVVYLTPPHDMRASLDPRIACRFLNRQSLVDIRAMRSYRRFLLDGRKYKIFCINTFSFLFHSLSMLRRKGDWSIFLTTNTTFTTCNSDRVKIFLSRLFLREGGQVIFGSQLQRDHWKKRYGFAGIDNRVIYNGVEPTVFSRGSQMRVGDRLREELRISDKTTVIGAVGQLRPEKGHGNLIRACKSLKGRGGEFKLLLVGDGVQRKHLIALALELGLSEDVVFLGQVQDVRPALYIMDIFVLPSTTTETFSNAALEAMSMEVPVVLSDIAGAKEMVADGVNGLLYPSGDIKALCACLERLIAEPRLRRGLAERAKRRVVEQFSFQSMFQQYAECVLD